MVRWGFGGLAGGVRGVGGREDSGEECGTRTPPPSLAPPSFALGGQGGRAAAPPRRAHVAVDDEPAADGGAANSTSPKRHLHLIFDDQLWHEFSNV